jgi:hypothetical protein
MLPARQTRVQRAQPRPNRGRPPEMAKHADRPDRIRHDAALRQHTPSRGDGAHVAGEYFSPEREHIPVMRPENVRPEIDTLIPQINRLRESAEPLAGLEDGDVASRACQTIRGAEASRPRADDPDARAPFSTSHARRVPLPVCGQGS